MKKKRLSTEQIAAVLHQAEQGIPVVELCRQVGISEQTLPLAHHLSRWFEDIAGMAEVSVCECRGSGAH